MKKIILVFVIGICLLLSSCFRIQSESEHKVTVEALRDIEEMTVAVTHEQVPAEHVIPYIQVIAKNVANKIDEDKEYPAHKTAEEIKNGYIISVKENKPNPVLQELMKQTQQNLEDMSSFSWAAILSGSVIALGFVGKFLGGPWNIGGNVLQLVARKVLPDYEKNKKAAVGAIVSVDKLLDEYGALLDTLPGTKKQLEENLGEHPVIWMKKRLKSAQTDLSTTETSELVTTLKKEMTTENGILKPTIEEIDKFIAKKV